MPKVSDSIKKELLSLKKEDLTVNFLISKISTTTKNVVDPNTGKKRFDLTPPAWNLKATMQLDAHEYTNIEPVMTTVGIFLVNKLLFEGNIDSILDNHYLNETMTADVFGKVVEKVSIALLDNKLPLNPNVVKFIQAFEFYGLMLCSAVSPSFTQKVMHTQTALREKRDELFAKYDDEPSLSEAVHIEDNLTADAKKSLKNDPGMSLFDSGARGSFADSYKMMSLMIGPVKNPATGKYDIVKSNLIDGIQKKDIPAIANTIVNAAYPKAIGTAEGGYLTKQFYAVYQSIAMDEAGTDCGSKGYLPVFLTASNYDTYLWQYVVTESGKLVLLDSNTYKQFLNQTILLRSPIGCLGAKLCNKCMGERFFKLGIANVGLTTGRLPNSIMNASLKNFHTTKVKFTKVNPNSLLID